MTAPRTGPLFTGTPQINAKGAPSITKESPCGRCGGQGGSEVWKFTGWTCFQCGGSGRGSIVCHKLYTAEQLAKLNATADKKAAAKAEKLAVKVAKIAAERAERWAVVTRDNGPLFERAAKFSEQNPFIASVMETVARTGNLSEKQMATLISACDKCEARAVAVAGSGHVGEIGKRIEVAVTVERVSTFERAGFGYYDRAQTVYVSTMRDAAGNSIVCMSPAFKTEVGETFTLRASVKEHSEYRGEKQTKVIRATRARCPTPADVSAPQGLNSDDLGLSPDY